MCQLLPNSQIHPLLGTKLYINSSILSKTIAVIDQYIYRKTKIECSYAAIHHIKIEKKKKDSIHLSTLASSLSFASMQRMTRA